MSTVQRKAWCALRQALWATVLNVLLVALYFIATGHLARRTTLERGAHLVNPRALKRRIRSAKIASDLNLDGVPLIKNKETSHILITGTTGAGKPTIFTRCCHRFVSGAIAPLL